MHQQGVAFLDRLLRTINAQDYQDIEIVITDHSIDDDIQNYVQALQTRFPVIYSRNVQDRGSSSANFNNGFRLAKGAIIKPMCQDDYFPSPHFISLLVDRLIGSTRGWCACCSIIEDATNGTLRLFRPKPTHNGLLVGNPYGAPSAIAFLNMGDIFFRKELIWVMDIELYIRLHRALGAPLVLRDLAIVTSKWCGQVTSTHAR